MGSCGTHLLSVWLLTVFEEFAAVEKTNLLQSFNSPGFPQNVSLSP